MTGMLFFGLDYVHVLLFVALAFFAGMWLFRKDTEIENRRRQASSIAGVLKNTYGMTLIPGMLEDYSVGDYSGVARRIKDIAEILLDPKKAAVEFGKVFEHILEQRMKDPEARAALLEKIEKLRLAEEGE